jgi:hypothetical protein
MNRAWIPAGALAGVSVAGLIALGPLTDSMGTQVSFPPGITGVQAPTANAKPIPVSYKQGVVGVTRTAALTHRGGRSKAAVNAASTTSGSTGEVGYRHTVVTAPAHTPAAPVTTPPKKTPKRQTSITATGETNGDAGLAGGSSQSTGRGEQAQTPAGDGP